MATFPKMFMGHVEDFSHLAAAEQERVRRTVSSYNDVKDLVNIADSFTTLPDSAFEALLKDAIRHAGDGVAETFFNLHHTDAIYAGKNFSQDVNDIAVCLMSSNLSQVAKHDFNKVTNGAEAMKKLNALIKSESGTELGRQLLLENLIKSHGFGPYLADKTMWVKKLETLLEDEVYILGTIVKQLSSEVSLPVKMKLLILGELGASKSKFLEITQKWIALSNQSLIQPAVNFLHENFLLFASGWLDSNPFLNDVVNACNKSQTHTKTIGIPTGLGYPGLIQRTVTTFGSAVQNWINESYGPKRLGLSTGHQPNNVLVHTSSPGACFLPCTEVMLYNHKCITIEHLMENDKILGGDGNVGVISSEKVALVLEDDTHLFGFNEDKPFFLASHPFWTQDGWRAVDPHTAREENAWLDVGQLTEGDFVRRISSIRGNEIQYQWVEVKSIHSQVFPAGTKVYGVHTREGPRSYHANGYLVLENYPEITAQSTADGLNKLSFDEQKKLQETFNDLDPILTKAYGPAVAKAMRSMSERHHKSRQENPSRNQSKRVPLKDVSLPHLALHYQAGKTKSDSYEMPSKISLMRGHLFVNDEHVQEAKINANDNISWTRPVPGGKWEHGSMKLYHGRLQGHGFISLTQNYGDTESLASANFIAAAHLNTYKCYRSTQPMQGGKIVGGWQELGALQMGVDCSSGICREVGKIKMPPMPDFETLENHVVFTVDSKHQLSVHVAVPADFQEPLKYTKLSGVFSADFSTFTGECTAYDATKPDFEGQKYGWRGTIEHNVATMAMLSKARNESLKSKIHMQQHATHSIPSVQAADAVDGPQVSGMANALSFMTAEHLSVNELYLMTPPDSSAMHEQTFSKLQQAMKYEMKSSDRENILGVNRPTISGDFAAVADSYKDFFGNRFANAYMMNGLAQSTHYKDKITQDERNKLLYYFNGNAQGCLAQDRDYNNANNEVSRIAYLELQTDLNKYVKSTQGGPYWATQLFNRLNEQQVLNGLALQAIISETTKIINKQTMVLYCLDPTKDYGSKFYKKILMTRLNITRSYFNGSTDKHSGEIMKAVFSDIMHQLIVKILAGGDKTTSEIMKELNKQVGEAAKELNVDITKNAEESASDMMAHFETAISEIITLFNYKKGRGWSKLVESVHTYLQKSKYLFYTAKVVSFLVCQAMWAASFYFTIETFMNWKNLSPEKKVSLIMDVVSMSVDMIAKFPAMVKNFQDACATGKTGWNWIKAKVKVDADPAVADEIEMTVGNEVHEVNGPGANVDEVMAEEAAATAEDVPGMVSRWDTFFAAAEMFSKVTGFLASAAGCVVIGFQIANDFKTGAPTAQKALDICQGVTMAVATTALAVGLFVESAIIPVVGIVCAIIGVVLVIVSLFVHRDPPKPKPTKIDIYVSDTGKPFVDKLPAPSAKWLADYHKKHPPKKGA